VGGRCKGGAVRYSRGYSRGTHGVLTGVLTGYSRNRAGRKTQPKDYTQARSAQAIIRFPLSRRADSHLSRRAVPTWPFGRSHFAVGPIPLRRMADSHFAVGPIPT
jgi:hypothetical protein